MNIRLVRLTAATLALSGIAGVAAAAGCSVSSPGLAFGRYQPITLPGKFASVAVTSDATISIACSGIVNGGQYTIALGPSVAGSGDRISARYMSNPAGGPDMLFNLYREPNYATVWGDGMTAGSVLTGTISPGDSNQTHTVYGRIPGGQYTLWAGQFSTSLTITINYNP